MALLNEWLSTPLFSPSRVNRAVCRQACVRMTEHPTTHLHVSRDMEHTGRHSDGFMISLVHGIGEALVVSHTLSEDRCLAVP